jgi:DNA-binding MarR family transcriptional regulator
MALSRMWRGICSIINLANDFSSEVKLLEQDLMLEQVELEILNILNTEAKPMRAGEVSALIDVTYQLVGKRTSKLQEMNYVEKKRSDDDRMRSTITDRAKSIYFVTPNNANIIQ